MGRRGAFFLCVVALASPRAAATPPYGDPNQPYDRLPGTLETYHVKWARPYAGGRLHVLFILPYMNAREVVETAQRLDLHYTVIMNAGFAVWDQGYWEGASATPLKGIEAKVVLDDLSRRRLSLGHTYDAIVIGKVSWPIIPEGVRNLVLQHVARGTGLVYVSPNRLKPGLNSRQEMDGRDPTFTRLFETNTEPAAAAAVLRGLPLDVMPLHALASPADDKPISGVGREAYAQSPLCLMATQHGAGRVLALDYMDETVAAWRASSSLTASIGGPWNHPTWGDDFEVMYDYGFALLARAILWAARREPRVQAAVAIEAPRTDLKAPVDAVIARHAWRYPTPAVVVARPDLPQARAVLSAKVLSDTIRTLSFQYAIRDLRGVVRLEGGTSVAVPADRSARTTLPVPSLERGTYLLDLRVLDQADNVLDFASTSFRVESAQHVTAVRTDKDAYEPGATIAGSVAFSQALAKDESPAVWAADTWGRTVAQARVELQADRLGAAFSLPVHRPLSRLWDIHAAIRQGPETVDAARTWVGLPNWTFDDYMFMLIFAPTPAPGNWKGNLYGRLMRDYGINATFTYLIYSNTKQYEVNERFHLQSVSYAEHYGELGGPGERALDGTQERTNRETAELLPILERIAATGRPVDPQEFPYKLDYGHFQLGAAFINARLAVYQESARFGTPFYVLTGENYLSNEFAGLEDSGFGREATRRFQAWCRREYGNDLAALNAEWNTHLTSWDEVRGILLPEAVEKNQMPRWVDFRYFMRSQVWSQLFIDWTAMMRRFIPQARTGRCGHDHHDFSRYRDAMTCAKLYIGQEPNSEWRHALTAELQQSFSGDRSFLLAPQSMIRWTYDLATPLANERWPWLVLFLGLNGFDWERGLSAETLGGESCFTPCYSEALPYFRTIADEVRFLQRGIGKLTIASRPWRSGVALLWSPRNHYISRLFPFQPNGFSGTWMYNCSVVDGAPSDALALLQSLRIRPTIVAPEDLAERGLQKRGFRALVLPYNKGLSRAEEEAIRAFVQEGGLVIADNEPGICTEHGRDLKEHRRLKDLFPVFDRKHVVRVGQGHAAYLPGELNGYVGRLEKGDYTGADSVGALLRTYAGQEPPVELVDERGLPRRDTLMPVFCRGQTTLLGLLRAVPASQRNPEGTTIRLRQKAHVWDVRHRRYVGFGDTFPIRLDLRPHYYALLPANPTTLLLNAPGQAIPQGQDVTIEGQVRFDPPAAGEIGQAVHVRVWSPSGQELECFRQNLVFDGPRFQVVLPISFSEPPGRYTAETEHVITGLKAQACFDVRGGP